MELIRIEKKNGQNFISSLKEVYLDAGMDKTHWSRWYNKNVMENMFFVENQDYQTLAIEANGNETKDFVCTVDMAKHLIMQMPTEKAFAYRQYLINFEKLPGNYKEALLALVAKEEEKEKLVLTVNTLKTTVAETAEKILIIDSLHLEGSVKIGQLSKTLSIKGLGQNNFFRWLRTEKIFQSNNTPYQTYAEHFTSQNNEVKNLGMNIPTTLFKLSSLQWLLKRLKRAGFVVNKEYDELIKLLG